MRYWISDLRWRVEQWINDWRRARRLVREWRKLIASLSAMQEARDSLAYRHDSDMAFAIGTAALIRCAEAELAEAERLLSEALRYP